MFYSTHFAYPDLPSHASEASRHGLYVFFGLFVCCRPFLISSWAPSLSELLSPVALSGVLIGPRAAAGRPHLPLDTSIKSWTKVGTAEVSPCREPPQTDPAVVAPSGPLQFMQIPFKILIWLKWLHALRTNSQTQWQRWPHKTLVIWIFYFKYLKTSSKKMTLTKSSYNNKTYWGKKKKINKGVGI